MTTKTYRVTVVRMVEGTAIVEAESANEAKQWAQLAMEWKQVLNREDVGFEVVGEPILCENPDGEEVT